LFSVSKQNVQPSEIIIIDASDNDLTYNLCKAGSEGLISEIKWFKADERGAATQRNIGTQLAGYQFILYMDDDILLEEGCFENLWQGIHTDDTIGGVCPFVTNQKYENPGKISRFMYRFMSGFKLKSYAGKCIGPAWNLWPEDNTDKQELVPLDWMSTVCALYRFEALPQPVFPNIFKGYSIMEDVYLSLTVAKSWKIYNITNARIFHDSQVGEQKKNIFNISRMQLVNRHFIMKYVMNRHSFKDYTKLFILELFLTVANFKNIKKMILIFFGKIAGTIEILGANINHKNQ